MNTDVEAAGPVLTIPGAPVAFHVMAKPTGAICNLDCEYCFFLSKEMLYPGSRFRMAEELQKTYIRQLLEAHAQAPEVIVAWQGGEPTIMGLDFFRRSIELQQQQYVRPGQRILNTLQTNGTLLNDEWGAFLKEHDFLVGISIDGPREIHDTYRVSKGGKPTFDRESSPPCTPPTATTAGACTGSCATSSKRPSSSSSRSSSEPHRRRSRSRTRAGAVTSRDARSTPSTGSS
jgi:hypothetical protein